MFLLILSDKIKNMYDNLEIGSIGYFYNDGLDKVDLEYVLNNQDECYIMALITEDDGLVKIVFSKLSNVKHLKNDEYNFFYKVIYVIEDKEVVSLFNHAFPFAFIINEDILLSRSKELVKFIKYLDDNIVSPSKAMALNEIIMTSDYFRVLSSKVQVYKSKLHEGTYSKLSYLVTTRQNALDIAKQLEVVLDIKLDYTIIEDVVSGANIGHLPYSYAGEKSINKLLNSEAVICNKDLLKFNTFIHSFESARLLLKNKQQFADHELDIISGILAHANPHYQKYGFNSETSFLEYINKYYCLDKQVLEHLFFDDGYLCAKKIESQIAALAFEITQKAFDVEFAIRTLDIDFEEMMTRLKMLSDFTGDVLSYDLNDDVEKVYSAKQLSKYVSNYLITSAVAGVNFEALKSKKTCKYIKFTQSGEIMIDVINNYFASKLLLSKDVRIYDKNSELLISKLFTYLYNDINLLPSFYQSQILDELKNQHLINAKTVLSFLAYDINNQYFNLVLYSDLTKSKLKRVDVDKIVQIREIIIQNIIDYMVSLSDIEVKLLVNEISGEKI